MSREWCGKPASATSLLLPARYASAAEPLKISHQFPGGSDKEGDFRHRLCVKFADALDKRSNGALKANVYPGSSLMKVNAQFSAARKGAPSPRGRCFFKPPFPDPGQRISN